MPGTANPGVAASPRGRCRCGHYPSQHLVVRPVEGSASFRLVAAGPCAVCGAATCAAYTPGEPPASG